MYRLKRFTPIGNIIKCSLSTSARRINGHPAASSSSMPVWKKWDDGLTARRMTRDEAKFIAKKFHEEWPVICTYDMEIMYDASEPPGEYCYSFDMDGELVGTCVTPEVAPNIFNYAGLYVKKELRGRRIMRRILEYSTSCAKGRIIAVSNHLSTNEALRQGYKDLWTMLQYTGTIPSQDTVPSGICEAASIPFDRIIEYDNKIYLTPNFPFRRKVLQGLFNVPGSKNCVALNTNGDVVGYGHRRPSDTAGIHVVGPMYADNYDIAQDLLKSLAVGIKDSDELTLESCELNEDFKKLMKNHNFECKFDTHVVMLGPPLDFFKPQIYSMTSADITIM